MKTVEIYGRILADGLPCKFCERAKALMEKRGYPVEYIDITDDEELQAEFKTRTNGAMTVPQIFVGIQKIGGFTDLVRADGNGALQQMLQGE